MAKRNIALILKFLILIVGSVSIATWLCQKLNVERHDDIANNQSIKIENLPERRRTLEEKKPDWIFIGNSMLRTRLLIDDSPEGSRNGIDDLSGLRCEWLRRGASQSAIWWFYLKNIIAKANHTPQVVTIFFRDTDLTWPDYRTSGLFAEYLESLKEGPEPEFDQVINGIQEGQPWALAQTQLAIKKLFPQNVINRRMRHRVQNLAFETFGLGNLSHGERREELNTLFSLESLRSDLHNASKGAQIGGQSELDQGEAAAAAESSEGDDDMAANPGMYDMGPKEFHADPHSSFLPHMIKLAKKKGFVLHFHRIKRRPPTLDGVPPHETTTRQDNETMIRYMKDLATFCEKEGVILTDETTDPIYTLAMYQDGDHIREAYRPLYTAHFWKTVKDKLPFKFLNSAP